MTQWLRRYGMAAFLLLALALAGGIACGKGAEEGDNDPNYYKGKDFSRATSSGAKGKSDPDNPAQKGKGEGKRID